MLIIINISLIEIMSCMIYCPSSTLQVIIQTHNRNYPRHTLNKYKYPGYRVIPHPLKPFGLDQV